jgi:hypothetical protein
VLAATVVAAIAEAMIVVVEFANLQRIGIAIGA